MPVCLQVVQAWFVRWQTRCLLIGSIAWIIFSPAFAVAQETTDAELIEELEEAAAQDAAEQEEQRDVDGIQAASIEEEDPLNRLPPGARAVVGNEANPSFSIILDFAGAYFTQEDRIRMGGHAPTRNGPAIQGAELAASASIDPFFRFDMAFELYHLHLEEIYATTTSLPWNLQVRFGQFKSNIGRHNPTHLHQWPFVVQPLPNQFLFGAEGLGLPGVELSYLFPLPWYVELVGALQMGEAGSFATKSLLDGDPKFKDFIYPARLVQFFDLTDAWAAQLGLNAVFGTGPYGPEVGNRTYAYGADLFFKWRPVGWGDTGYTYLAWNTEAWFREMEVPGEIWRDWGGYSDLIFGISKEWECAVRGEYWKQLSGDAAGEIVERAPAGVDSVRGSAVVSFMPSHFSRLRLQYTFENNDGLPNNQIVLLQLEVSAGAHGAHRY